MLEFNATFFIAMISFVVFMIIMNAILYKPLSRVVKERKDLIDTNNEMSKIADEKCNNLIEWQKTSVEKAKNEAKVLYQKILNDYKLKRDTELDFEKNLSKKEASLASAELEKEIIGAEQKLNEEVKVLADIITDKIIKG